MTTKPYSKKLKRQFVLSSPPPSSKTLALAPPDQKPASGSTQSGIVGKFSKKHLKQGSPGKFLKVIPLAGEISKRSHVKVKGFCLSFVHRGVNKAISHETTIEMHGCGYEGQLAYYKDVKVYLSDTYPAAEIHPVIKVQLNSQNITRAEKAILDAYRYDDEKSIFRKFKKTPYYTLIYDGISKFWSRVKWRGGGEGGAYMRGIDDYCVPFSLHYCLNKKRGGVTGVKTAHEIITNAASVVASDSSAYHMFDRQFIESFGQEEPNYIPPVAPRYFKIGELVNVDDNDKVVCIAVSNRFPVANIGDGVGVNIKAARVLRDLFGFTSPDFWCSAHAASGSIKRLATSKTMNVLEVTTLYECLKMVIKPFESSVKNKETLDQYMDILEMTPLHILSWCQTRMAHFLKSCRVFDGMLAAAYDVMYTKGIRVDERDLLLSFINVYVLKIYSLSLKKHFSVKLNKLTCLCRECLICQTLLPD